MADEVLKRDANHVPVLGAITNDAAQEVRMLRVDPATGRLLATATGGITGTIAATEIAYGSAANTITGDLGLIRDITDPTNRYGIKVSAVTGGTNNWNIWSGSTTVPVDPYEFIPSARNVFNVASNTTGDEAAFAPFINTTNTNFRVVSGVRAGATTSGTAGGFVLLGFEGNVLHYGSGNVTSASGISGYIETDVGGGDINDASALSAAGVISQAGSVITNAYGVNISSNDVATGGTITNNYGLYISNQTAGGTSNYSIYTGTGQIRLGDKITTYNGIVTAGWGVPAVYGYGRFTAQNAAKAGVAAYTVGAADGSFEISANVLVTTATAHSFSVTCAYTDEGNTSRTLTLGFTQLSGATFVTLITNVTGATPYESPVYHIRAKSGTTITISTTGTFTTVTYNVEGSIKQIA